MSEKKQVKKEEMTRYLRKNQSLFTMISKIKLWPSRSGILHGVKNIESHGNMIKITTFCGETFIVYDSKKSRSARWLRNRWCTSPCPRCNVPEWKLSKYSATIFK